MQLNKLAKSLMLTIPLFTLAACPSTSTTDGSDSMDGSAGMNGGLSGANGQYGSVQEQLEALQRANLVFFGFDKYDISPEFEELLNAHALFLRSNPDYKIVVEGHADERGTPEYNIALGERRANAVQMYLQGKGVSGSQISIVSYGKEKPAVLGHDEAAHAKNRRAVLVY